MIAVGMNGQPLTDIHGFPARLVTPGLYGYVGATKWLTKLTLTTYAAQQSYWTQRQWAIDGPIKTSARIDTPAPLSTVPPGRTVVGGVAWAQHAASAASTSRSTAARGRPPSWARTPAWTTGGSGTCPGTRRPASTP